MPSGAPLLAIAIAASATITCAARANAEEPLAARSKSGYVQILATAFVGDGLRFNNPYRLSTPLGSDAESLSRTASYVDFGLAATTGDPLGVQHGLALRFSHAIEGITQSVLAPTYLLWRRWHRTALYGRGGVAIVLDPETTWGFEAACGGVWFWRSGIGLAAEIVGDVFYGAGTREVAKPAYPTLSAQLGFVVAYEVLP